MTDEARQTEGGDEKAPSWTRFFTYGSIALAAIALVVTIWSVGPARLLAQLADIGIGFAAVLLIELAITGCDSLALSGFLGKGGRRPSFLHVVRAQVSGRAINAVTPLASLGEATKATTLMEQTSSHRAIAAVIHYNIVSIGIRLLTIAIGAPICALVLDLPEALNVVLWVGGAVAAAALAGGVVLVRRGMLATAIDAVRAVRLVSQERAKRWRDKLAGIDKHLRPRPDQRARQRWSPALFVIGSRMLSLVSMWVVLASVGYRAGVGTIAAVATAGTLISMMASIVPMGLGISEGSNAALFAALGAPASLGVTMVLGNRITLLCYAAIGIFLVSASTAVGSARKLHVERRTRKTQPLSTTTRIGPMTRTGPIPSGSGDDRRPPTHPGSAPAPT